MLTHATPNDTPDDIKLFRTALIGFGPEHSERVKGFEMKRFAFVAAGLLALAPFSAANAQAVNTQAIVAACSGAATNCGAVVRAQVAALRAAGVAGPALDAQLGQIAAAVASVGGPGATPAARAQIGATLREVAAQVSSPAQAAAIVQAAVTVESAAAVVQVPAVVPPAPAPASPS